MQVHLKKYNHLLFFLLGRMLQNKLQTEVDGSKLDQTE